MDSWYRADNLVEGQREYRSYEWGALKGHMETPKDDLPDDYPYDTCQEPAEDLRPSPLSVTRPAATFKPLVTEVPGLPNVTIEILPDDDHGQPLDWNEVKTANPWYFEALKQAAAIMRMRRAKYSGEDPFSNFERMAQIKNTSIAEVFQFYIAEGLARTQVSTRDFEDETFNDRLIDLANYALLWYSYRLKNSTR